MEHYKEHIKSEQGKIDELRLRKINTISKIDKEIVEHEQKIKHYKNLLQKSTKGG